MFDITQSPSVCLTIDLNFLKLLSWCEVMSDMNNLSRQFINLTIIHQTLYFGLFRTFHIKIFPNFISRGNCTAFN